MCSRCSCHHVESFCPNCDTSFAIQFVTDKRPVPFVELQNATSDGFPPMVVVSLFSGAQTHFLGASLRVKRAVNISIRTNAEHQASYEHCVHTVSVQRALPVGASTAGIVDGETRNDKD